jgi:hypothetical protein
MNNDEKLQFAREALASLGVKPEDGARGVTPVPGVSENTSDDEKQAALDGYTASLLSKRNSELTGDEKTFLRDGLRSWARSEGFE